jgi:hypothetical protein
MDEPLLVKLYIAELSSIATSAGASVSRGA